MAGILSAKPLGGTTLKVIRKDIAPPSDQPKTGRRNKNPFDVMDIQDSFLVEDDRLSAVRVSVCRENKKGGKKYLVGRYESKRGVEWRCWRIA